MRKFSRSVCETHSDLSRNETSVKVALADCVNTTLRAVQERISKSKRENISIIDLQDSIQEPASILQCLSTIIEGVGNSQECYILLSKMFQVVQELEYRISWLRPFLLAVLAKSSSPWLETISEWIGLVKIGPSDDALFIEQGMFMAPMVILDDDTGEVADTDELVITMVSLCGSLSLTND